jgi:hypothetical protein
MNGQKILKIREGVWQFYWKYRNENILRKLQIGGRDWSGILLPYFATCNAFSAIVR